MAFGDPMYTNAEALARPAKVTTYRTRKQAHKIMHRLLDILVSALPFPPRATVLRSDLGGFQIHFYGFEKAEHATMMASAGHHCTMA